MGTGLDAGVRLLILEGYFALDVGEDRQARESFKQAVKIALENQSPPNALGALAGLVALDVKDGRHEQALEMASFVLAHPAGTQETRSRAEKLRAELEAQLTPEQIKAAHSRARSMTLDSLARDLSG